MKEYMKSSYKWYIRRISGTVIEIDETESVNCGQNWVQIRQKNGSFIAIPNIQVASVEGIRKKGKNYD